MANRFQNRNTRQIPCASQAPQSNGNLGNSWNNGNHCAYRRRLQAIDFALVDLVLYLDAYPNSAEALAHYHELQEERKQLMSSAPHDSLSTVTSRDNHTPNQWTWIQGPWPWEVDANC
ncbi:MAG: spore coat protein CotJB [Clostridia bacterium]|nr:spore coat protein CotJB [Clostridia bacterium]